MIHNVIFQAKRLVRRLKRSRCAQTLVEYALILAFISILAIAMLQSLGGSITQVFGYIVGTLSDAQSASYNAGKY